MKDPMYEVVNKKMLYGEPVGSCFLTTITTVVSINRFAAIQAFSSHSEGFK